MIFGLCADHPLNPYDSEGLRLFGHRSAMRSFVRMLPRYWHERIYPSQPAPPVLKALSGQAQRPPLPVPSRNKLLGRGLLGYQPQEAVPALWGSTG